MGFLLWFFKVGLGSMMSFGLRSMFAGLLIALFFALAGWGGLQHIEHRPIHADESVHAVKLGKVLDEGISAYRYDPSEYHGPTLYVAASAVAWAFDKSSLVALEARDLRVTTLLFGIGLIALLWLILDGLSPLGTVLSGAMMLVCPLLTYYARDFIHETLFVFFTMLTIVAGWRYARTPVGHWRRAVWAGIVGGGIGLMWATKEQFVAVVAAMAAGLALNGVWSKLGWAPVDSTEPRGSTDANFRDAAGYGARETQGSTASPASRVSMPAINWRHVLIGAMALVVVWSVLFSSVFSYWQGLWESVATYGHYFGRGMGQGQAAEIHVQPWWYYLRLLSWVSYPPAPVWTYAFILGLAAIGAIVGFVPRWAGPSDARLARFLTVYSVALLVAFSLVPYKQPWLLMGPLHGLILLAGIGGAALWRGAWHWPSVTAGIAACGVAFLIGYVSLPYQPSGGWIAAITVLIVAGSVCLGALIRLLAPSAASRILAVGVVALALFVGLGHLAYQTRWANGRYAADQRNPLAHAQTSTDVRNLVKRVDQLAAHAKDQSGPLLQVVAATPWPMPWYLRHFERGRVGYLDQSAEITTSNLNVPMLIVDTRFYEKVQPKLRRTYQAARYGLRPGTFLRLYVDKPLWEEFMAGRR
jgi:uncharacterized protein (TIGR03663 family)